MPKAYICNTFYQIYIAIIKTMLLQEDLKPVLVVTDIVNDFSELVKKIEKENLFSDIVMLHEPSFEGILNSRRINAAKGNTLSRLINRLNEEKIICDYLEKNINFSFNKYELYLFDDCDPIGHLLYKKKINYHLIEDCLDLYKDDFFYSYVKSFWLLKRILCKVGLYYIAYGRCKYALDIEVNDKSIVKNLPMNKVIMVPRKELIDKLNSKQKDTIYSIFENENLSQINTSKPTLLILGQCLYPDDVDSLEKQINIYRKIINHYSMKYSIYLKPHPRDILDYKKYFPDVYVMDKYYPVEILNLQTKLHFNAALTVYSSSLDGLSISDEKIFLGREYISEYL